MKGMLISVGLVEPKWVAQSKEQISQLVQLDEGGCLWVKVRPLLPEDPAHLVVEETCFLDLGVIIALKDDRDEELQEDQIHNEGVACKEGVSDDPIATTNGFSSCYKI